jgi:hypothetical protein
MFTKIMMARMNSLEESFRDVIHEMRSQLRHGEGVSQSRGRVAKADRKDRDGEKEAVRPATAGADTDGATPRSSGTPEMGNSAQSETGATMTELAKKEQEEPVEVPAHNRPLH